MYCRTFNHIIPFGKVHFIYDFFFSLSFNMDFLENILELELRPRVQELDAGLC